MSGFSVHGGLSHYRYGKGDTQVHYAPSARPRWERNRDLGNVALLHLTLGLGASSRAASGAEREFRPVEPTLCVGQPPRFDPSRAPASKAILWLPLSEVSRFIKGDAASGIVTPGDGCWTEETRECYAGRVEALLARHIEDFSKIRLVRRAYWPSDLEAMNVNLVGGDPYRGFCSVDQFFIRRPFKSTVNRRTHVTGHYHIGASTRPGPGLSGGPGFPLASSLR